MPESRAEPGHWANCLSVEDIRPARVMADQQAAMQADIDWLTTRRASFEEVACPACDADASNFLYEKWGMPQRHCRACGTQFVSPRPTEATLVEFYCQSANYDYWARNVFAVSANVRRERIFPAARPGSGRNGAPAWTCAGGTLVEVGAAYGLFCEEVKATGSFGRVVAIEPTPELASRCRSLGLETIEAAYEEVELDRPADMIANFEVIEHLHAPRKFLDWCLAALRPGGVLMITCPNIRGFETLTLGAEAGSVDHEHLNMFTPDSLALLARRVGFEGVDVSTPGRLDYDLVREVLKAGRVDEAALGPFVAALMRGDTPELEADFMAFLQRHKLSSHMMMIAREAGEGGGMIAVFVSNKLISTDTILPLLFELAARRGAKRIRLYTTNQPTYEAIRRNRVLLDGIEAIGELVYIGATDRSRRSRLVHRLAVLPTMLYLIGLALAGRLTLVHFGVLNAWPFRALYLAARRRTFYVQPVAVGLSATEAAIDNLVTARRSGGRLPAAGTLVAFQRDWPLLADPRLAAVPRFVDRPTQNLPAWTGFLERSADRYFAEEFARAGVAPSDEILTVMLGYFGPLDFLSRPDAVRELLRETIEVLLEEGGGLPIFLKPHVITDEAVLGDVVAGFPGAPIVVSHLHPGVLAARSRLFVANYYSTTLSTGRLLEVPTIEYSDYNAAALAETQGGSMRPEAVDHFVNAERIGLRAAVRACLETPRRPVATGRADPALLDALAGPAEATAMPAAGPAASAGRYTGSRGR